MEHRINILGATSDKRRRVYIKFAEANKTYLTNKEVDIVKRLTVGRRAKEIAWEIISIPPTNTEVLKFIPDPRA